MGSGSTGVACVNLNRNFIGIEKDDHYFDVTKERIEHAEKVKSIQLF
jgi:site-specific DNA-methyltransferase (adenine-specific)